MGWVAQGHVFSKAKCAGRGKLSQRGSRPPECAEWARQRSLLRKERDIRKSRVKDGWVDLVYYHAQCDRLLYLLHQRPVHPIIPHLRPRHIHPPHSPGSLPRTSFQSQSALPLVMGHSKSTSRSSTPGSYSQSIFSERIVPPSCSHLSCASQKWHLEGRKKDKRSIAKVLSRPWY